MNETIESIDRKIHALKERRKALIRIQERERRLALNARLSKVLIAVRNNPGITASELMGKVRLERNVYNNTMTALVRRKLIVNKGTRRSPSWYSV